MVLYCIYTLCSNILSVIYPLRLVLFMTTPLGVTYLYASNKVENLQMHLDVVLKVTIISKKLYHYKSDYFLNKILKKIQSDYFGKSSVEELSYFLCQK